MLQDEALQQSRRLACGPTQAYGEIKRLFLRAGSGQLEAQLEDEALTLARVATGPDAQEGIAAMVEKRKPVFRDAVHRASDRFAGLHSAVSSRKRWAFGELSSRSTVVCRCAPMSVCASAMSLVSTALSKVWCSAATSRLL